MANLSTVRKNMIENMIKYLADDCYIYIMTAATKSYDKISTSNNDFFKMEIILSSEFSSRLINSYKELNEENPELKVNNVYSEIVTNTIKRIQSENHPFYVGVNVNSGRTYDIVVFKKKNEAVTPEPQ